MVNMQEKAMGRGLSELQKKILKLALKAPGTRCNTIDLVEEAYGGHRYKRPYLTERLRWRYPGSTITPAARAAISRAVRRLEARGLVGRITRGEGFVPGVFLTLEGVGVAAGLNGADTTT